MFELDIFKFLQTFVIIPHECLLGFLVKNIRNRLALLGMAQ